MPPIQLLMKPASGNCNLRCRYCFYRDEMENRSAASFGIMSEETLEAVVKKTLAYAEHSCGFTFQGGEPTLAGLSFFERLTELQNTYNVKNVAITNAIQTNGFRLDEEWARFLSKHHFLAGVSLDGTKYTHEAYRRTIDGKGTFSEVVKTLELFDRYGVDYNILTVVHQETARAVSKIYSFYQKHGWNYLQFIPCLDPLGETPGQQEYALTPEVYGEFLIRLFELWYLDLQKGCQPYIRQFENYIAVLMGLSAESCDQRGFCSMQYVTEADGSVYPCDFFVTDEYRLGSFLEDSLEDMELRGSGLGFDGRTPGIRSACSGCGYYPLCRGGCARHWSGGSNYFCRSYQMFFKAALPRMKQIAARISWTK